MSNLQRIALVLFGAMASSAVAQEDLERGHAIVKANCGACHAIESEGVSPLPEAPLFRTLGERYPVADLEEALAEGILTGHPAMPELSFEPDDIAAIIAYLESLQKS